MDEVSKVRAGSELTPLHPNHVKVLRLQAAIFALPFAVAAFVLEVVGVLPTGAVIVPILALLAWLVVWMPIRRHYARGFQIAADRLRVVRGILFRSDTVVPFSRVQHIDVSRGPIERYYGLSTLVLHTAGTHNSSIILPGLGEQEALAMREAIREKIASAAQ
ncbi:PH domain-containing protein [Altererythrobacter salegens]|uniref:PH domain-containing protein n=1 Tax=Croceibacterium salegens TaxID=1737568 RepID=A0A6I4SZE6_9SPHN|nr:PH domain-containing protein [Croceibacterium salegens]MXO60600.1 PH domain-containing protein [Croceibacterium salegens]